MRKLRHNNIQTFHANQKTKGKREVYFNLRAFPIQGLNGWANGIIVICLLIWLSDHSKEETNHEVKYFFHEGKHKNGEESS